MSSASTEDVIGRLQKSLASASARLECYPRQPQSR
jgi:hypothetical protein